MALILDENGLPELNNRGGYFENGSPVNPKYWDEMKKLPSKCSHHKPYFLHYDEIYKCFNPIKSEFSGMVIHAPIHRFKVFCLENDLEFQEFPTHSGVLIYLKRSNHPAH